MKIITLIPVKNEDWILEYTLKNISPFSDYIIVADQNSTDNTLAICKKFEKVKVVNNPNKGHSNLVRWQLLEEARKIEGNNLIFCIDADEIISPQVINKIKNSIKNNNLKPGVGFSFSWIQIFNSSENYRIDGPWKNNIKSIAFWDDRKIDYKREFVINDHTSRIPEINDIHFIDTYPLLHLQSISKERGDIKQVWYKCSELINNPNDAKKINYKYSLTDSQKIVLEKTKKEWFDNTDIIKFEYNKNNDWHYKEMMQWFEKYGIEFFEPLQIWHINELHDIFIQKIKREPKPKTFPKILIVLNDIKNKIKNLIQ